MLGACMPLQRQGEADVWRAEGISENEAIGTCRKRKESCDDFSVSTVFFVATDREWPRRSR
jgi:hypothetical protein